MSFDKCYYLLIVNVYKTCQNIWLDHVHARFLNLCLFILYADLKKL